MRMEMMTAAKEEVKDINMTIYNKCRAVPESAKKTIAAGRLKGMTDINPMWRIKQLTEVFGPCGIGWKYTIDRQWLECADDGVAAFCNITFYFRDDDEWSCGIPATGGSKFVTTEKGGTYTNDECYKMALTDALSVACKMLGVGADVYWDKDITKYTTPTTPKAEAKPVDPERTHYMKAIAASGLDARLIDAACNKRFGKVLKDLTNEQLAEVAVLMAQNGADNAGA